MLEQLINEVQTNPKIQEFVANLLTPLAIVGFVGQVVFGGRFIIQWLVSEKHGRSVVPLSFWYMSLIGGVLLFVYATLKLDPVFMAGQGLGLFVYVRNLMLIRRQRRQQAEQSPSEKP